VEGEGHAFEDPDALRACAEAIEHMRAGNNLEWVTVARRGSKEHGSLRTACEVVAYYELEGFVAAAQATKPDHAQGREPRAK
jgi:hypothetical protein